MGGMLPFVELNGEEIGDSDIIIKELTAKFGKEDPAASLSADQKNVQHAMVTMVENHLLDHHALESKRYGQHVEGIPFGYSTDDGHQNAQCYPQSRLQAYFPSQRCYKDQSRRLFRFLRRRD